MKNKVSIYSDNGRELNGGAEVKKKTCQKLEEEETSWGVFFVNVTAVRNMEVEERDFPFWRE